MKALKLSALMAITATFAFSSFAQDPKLDRSGILDGPAVAKLGAVAEVKVPVGYTFVDGKTIAAFLRAQGEPAHEGLLGSLDKTNENWSVMFTYYDVGYVKDQDKDKLNADKMLKDIKEGTEEANKVRAKSGIPPIHVTGWEIPPRYNEETHNLEWAIRGESEGEQILNYDTRVLGRKGVMAVKLIVEPKEFEATRPTFTNLMAGFQYTTGQSYAEYKQGDKVAKYGLAALVTAGAGVAAIKMGFLPWLLVFLKKGFKFIILGVVAIAAFFKKMFGRLTGRKDDN